MAKDITLKSQDGSVIYYPKTVSDLVYNNESGKTVKEEIEALTGGITNGSFIWTKFNTSKDFPYNVEEGKTYTIKCTTNIAFTRLIIYYGANWGPSATTIIDGNKTEATFTAEKDADHISFYVVSGTDLADGIVNFSIEAQGVLDNKTEKVRIDIEGESGNYSFKKGDTTLNFRDLNNILQNSPDFAVFVHGKREHRCTMIDMDSTPKQMRFVAPILSEGVLKTQSFYVTSNDGVDITSITSSNINSENSSNKVSTLDNANNTTYPTTKAVADVIGNKINKGEVGTDDIVDGAITNDKLSSDIHFPKVEVSDLSEDTIVDGIYGDNLIDPSKVTYGKYLVSNGQATGNSSTYQTTDFIEIEQGEPYYLQQIKNDGGVYTYEARFVALFDANKQLIRFISNGIIIRGLVFDEGVKYIKLTTYNINPSYNNYVKIYFYKGANQKPYQPYGIIGRNIKDELIPIIEEEKLSADVQRKLNSVSVDVRPCSMTVKGDLNGTNTFEIPKNSIKNCKSLSFTGTLSNWVSNSKLLMGFGKTSYLSGWIEIDNTQLVVKYRTTVDTVKSTVAHGLTLTNNIQVNLYKDWGTTTINITSNGTTFAHTVDGWSSENGTIFATLENGSITDCSFSFYSDALTYENWLFGDSYFSLNAGDRWTSYLKSNNHLRNLLNAYSGEDDSNALIDCKNMLEMATPKRIIWCGGMNDSDSRLTNPTLEPNSSWLSAVNELKNICYAKGIELILCTIPSVFGGYSEDTGQSASRYHKAKNDYVRASGYRYIDFAKAVGASDTTGLWYGTTEQDIINKTGNGMLSSDGVHPTAKGAKTLYAQAVADVPELMTIKL